MKKFLFFLLYATLSIAANGQRSYNEAIQQGDAAFKNRQYKTAINNYINALVYDPLKKDTVNVKLNNVEKGRWQCTSDDNSSN